MAAGDRPLRADDGADCGRDQRDGRRRTDSPRRGSGCGASRALYAGASVGGLMRRGGSARDGNITSSAPARNASLAAWYAATHSRQVLRPQSRQATLPFYVQCPAFNSNARTRHRRARFRRSLSGPRPELAT